MSRSAIRLQILHEDRNPTIGVDTPARLCPGRCGACDRQRFRRRMQAARAIRHLIKHRIIRNGAVEPHQKLFAAAVCQQIIAVEPLPRANNYSRFCHD